MKNMLIFMKKIDFCISKLCKYIKAISKNNTNQK